MERLTQALVAMRKIGPVYIIDIIAFVGLILILLLVNSANYIGKVGVTVMFAFMIAEDFCDRTVDIRMFAGMVLFMILSVGGANILNFGIYFLGGMLFFQIIHLLSIQKIPAENTGSTQEQIKDCCNSPLAFLPSIGLAILVWEGVKRYAGFEIQPLALTLWWREIWLMLVVGLAVARFYFEYKKEPGQEAETIHGFGDGDVLVCAAWLAFLGVENFFAIFVVATALQLAFYGLLFIKRMGRKNTNEQN